MNKLSSRRLARLHNLYLGVLGLTIFAALFLTVTVVTNWSAVENEIAYAFHRPSISRADILSSATPLPTDSPAPIMAVVEPARLLIDKIGVDVPVVWNVPIDQTVESLNRGVAHLANSARLGEIGNLFITGHSSDYVWKHNPYAAVFSLLPKLQPGDDISFRENGQTFVYRVTQTKIVGPDHIEVTNQTSTPIITLMTCYPVGTTRERFIVQANLIAAPNVALTPVKQTGSYTLPEIKFR